MMSVPVASCRPFTEITASMRYGASFERSEVELKEAASSCDEDKR